MSLQHDIIQLKFDFNLISVSAQHRLAHGSYCPMSSPQGHFVDNKKHGRGGEVNEKAPIHQNIGWKGRYHEAPGYSYIYVSGRCPTCDLFARDSLCNVETAQDGLQQ